MKFLSNDFSFLLGFFFKRKETCSSDKCFTWITYKKGEKNPLKQVKLHLYLQKNICQCHYSFCFVPFHSFTRPHYGGSLFQYFFSYFDLNGNILLSEYNISFGNLICHGNSRREEKRQSPNRSLVKTSHVPEPSLTVSQTWITSSLYELGNEKNHKSKNLLREYDMHTAPLLR